MVFTSSVPSLIRQASGVSVKPRGEDELKELILSLTRQEEEDEMMVEMEEKEEEDEIVMELEREEDERDRTQEGGRNPKITGELYPHLHHFFNILPLR